jgi:amidase
MPDRRDLERRTRAVARLGSLLPTRSLRKTLRRQEAIADSINAVFARADVVLTPLCASSAPRVDDCPTSGAVRSLLKANTSAWLVPWNAIGQPGIAVPIGTDADGIPTAIHLAGRAQDEPTLLALAAEIEANRPFPKWADASASLDA